MIEEKTKAIQQKKVATSTSDRNWFDPSSDARFVRTELRIQENDSTEAKLQNIVRLTDEIFDHLSVYEQFYANPVGGGRGGLCAVADPMKKLDVPSARAALVTAEDELWKVYCALKEKRTSFVKQQLESLSIDEHTKELKVHLGSAGILIDDWLNVDAGGGDLMLNVNWGLALPDECAAFVYSSHMLEHLRFSDQAPVFVREVHRILAKGGTVRFVVPDIRKLLMAYSKNDEKYFESRHKFYPLNDGFMNEGVASLDYVLLFSGASHQVLNYNHKFGYDSDTLSKLLKDAGFSKITECHFQGSAYPELCVDSFSYNAQAADHQNHHYSLFIEATK